MALFMVWGFFRWHTLGPLICLQTSLMDGCYVSILEDHLTPFHDLHYPQMSVASFNMKMHYPTMSIVTRYGLEEISIITWPSHLSNLNTIEHIRDAVQHAVNARDPPSVNIMDCGKVFWWHSVPCPHSTSESS